MDHRAKSILANVALQFEKIHEMADMTEQTSYPRAAAGFPLLFAVVAHLAHQSPWHLG
jgi:hypothetical protein